jgi:hypothetical protein
MGPSAGTGSILVAKLSTEPLLASETSIVIKDILNVVIVS